MRPPPILTARDTWLNSPAPLFGNTLGDALTAKWTYRDTLQEFLALHDIDIEDVYKIHFDDEAMSIYRFKRNSTGHLFAENGKLAVLSLTTKEYLVGLEVFDY